MNMYVHIYIYICIYIYPHSAWFKPDPGRGTWLGSSSSWPVGEVHT